MKKNEKHCPKCGAEITDAKAKLCPGCGAKVSTPIFKKWWFWVILVVVVGGVAVGSGSGGDGEVVDRTTETKTNYTTSQSATSNDEKVPVEYKNALKKAESYSNLMHMSKQGIYDQLVSEYGEKFSADAAQYAIDHLDVNYNENALEKAKSYQKTMSMSKQAIYDQLISEYGEKFTPSEAQYAIDHLDD